MACTLRPPVKRVYRAMPQSDNCKMLTARATTSATVTRDTADCRVIAIFDQRDSGMVSVGLKAVALVNARYR